MGGVNGNGCDDGKDMLEKAIVEPLVFLRREVILADNHDVVVGQFLLKLKPAEILLGHQFLGKFPDLFQLLGGVQAIIAYLDNLLAHLAHQARHTHHEKLVEVVAGDGQKTQALEQRMVAIAGFFQHPHVEAQP